MLGGCKLLPEGDTGWSTKAEERAELSWAIVGIWLHHRVGWCNLQRPRSGIKAPSMDVEGWEGRGKVGDSFVPWGSVLHRDAARVVWGELPFVQQLSAVEGRPALQWTRTVLCLQERKEKKQQNSDYINNYILAHSFSSHETAEVRWASQLDITPLTGSIKKHRSLILSSVPEERTADLLWAATQGVSCHYCAGDWIKTLPGSET